jgi:RNA binding exosome subunit
MSRPRIVRQVEITVFTHATEDRSKVLKAVHNLFPKNAEFPNYTESILDGYFGDPIIPLHFIVKNRRPSSELFDNLINGLSSLDYLMLLDELPQRIDETKNLYLRLNKQKAFFGKYVLEKHDPIRIKVSLLVPHKADPADVLKEYMEEMRV